MADFYESPDSRNYLIGGHVSTIDGVNVGNIVTGTITPVLEEIERYDAVLGRLAPDNHDVAEEVVSNVGRIDVVLTLDEITRDNLHLFLGGARDGSNSINPLLRRRIQSALVIDGNSDTGMNFTWTVPKIIITPEGPLSYQTDDWVSITLNCEVYPDTNTPDQPFGIFELLGADA